MILVTSFIGSLIQTSGFDIKVTDLRDVQAEEVVTEVDLSAIGGGAAVKVTGFVESGLLYVPSNATASNPAPAVVLTHGYLNNRELQMPFAVELARRGFVVLAIDRENHGNNTVVSSSSYATSYGSGNYGASMYNAAAYLYSLDCVAKDAIAISGHSMGGAATNSGMLIDTTVRNAGGIGIIAAGLVQANNAANYAYHADHTMGNLKATDDEFFYKSKLADDSPSIARQYLNSIAAAQFIGLTYTGTAADSIQIENKAIYVGGVKVTATPGEKVADPFRAIYEAKEIHPLNHWSADSTANLVDFMYNALGTPDGCEYVKSTNQTWFVKEIFATLGLVGFFALIFPLADLLLTIPAFESLRKKEDEELALAPLAGVRKHVSYWVGAVITALFSGFIIEPMFSGNAGNLNWTNLSKMFFTQNTYFPQDTTGKVATWAIVCGLFALLVTAVIYLINRIIDVTAGNGEVKTASPFAVAKIGLNDFVKTVLLGGIIVAAMYFVVFINWDIFTVDFRFWTFDVKVFNVWYMLPAMLRYAVPFFIYYAINSMLNQGYRAKNLPEWATIAINAFFNIIFILVVFLIQYGTFTSTGVLWQPGMSLSYIVLFPIVPVLIVATIISRRLYVRTGNSWLGAVVNALLFTIMTVANTSASFAYAGFFA